MLDASKIENIDLKEWRASSPIAKALIDAARPEAERLKDERIARKVADEIAKGVEADKARAKWTAAADDVFYDDHEIYLQDGTICTVRDILENPQEYHNKRCADPEDPAYRDDDRIAIIDAYKGSIYSHAHQGVLYRLRLSAAVDFEGAEVDPRWLQGAPPPPDTFHVYSYNELTGLPPLRFLIEGLLPEKSFCVVYGPTKEFKTFVTLAMVLSLVTDKPFFGRAIWPDRDPGAPPPRVLYVLAEGQSDFERRIKAWCIDNDVTPETELSGLGIVLDPVIVDNAAMHSFVAKVKSSGPYDLVVFDTLNRNMEGNESETKDMGLFVKGCEEVRRALKTAVLVVHHTGHDRSRARGSSVLVAAVDASIRVSRQGPRTGRRAALTAENMRAADDGVSQRFEAVKVDLGGGKNSLAVRWLSEVALDFEPQFTVAERLMIDLESIGPDESYPTQAEYADRSGANKSTLSRAIKKLVEEKHLSLLDGDKTLRPTLAGREYAQEIVARGSCINF